MDNLFVWSLIFTAITGLFAVFNIFFDYEKKHPVKISKWGWVGVLFTLMLVAGNLFIKYFEKEQKDMAVARAEKREAAADSIREILVKKNDTLSDLISSFSKTTYVRFDSINREILSNSDQVDKSLDELSLVSSGITEVEGEIKQVSGDLSGVSEEMTSYLQDLKFRIDSAKFVFLLRGARIDDFWKEIEIEYGQQKRKIMQQMIRDYIWINKLNDLANEFFIPAGIRVTGDEMLLSEEEQNLKNKVSRVIPLSIHCKSLPSCFTANEIKLRVVFFFSDYVNPFEYWAKDDPYYADLYHNHPPEKLELIEKLDKAFYASNWDSFKEIFIRNNFIETYISYAEVRMIFYAPDLNQMSIKYKFSTNSEHDFEMNFVITEEQMKNFLRLGHLNLF